MMQFDAKKHAPLLFAAVGLLGLGYGLARVRADGAPKTQPLWYAGTVADAAGAPLEGSHSVSLRLFPADSGGSAACTAGPMSANFQKGRFRFDAASCATATSANPDLFAELSVDDKAFPRSKVGAVPYALEASHAMTATTAMTATNATNAASATNATNATTAMTATGASGALDTRIRAVESLKPTRPLGGNTSVFVRPSTNQPTVDPSQVDTFWQAGTAVITIDGSMEATITFPKPFPNGVIAQFATSANGNTGSPAATIPDNYGDKASFRVHFQGVTSGQYRINWLAIGW